MLKSLLFLLFAGVTAIALPGQNPSTPAAQNGRISIRGVVTDTVTSAGIPGIQLSLTPVAAPRGGVLQDPQALRDAATRAGIAAEEVDRLVASQAARAGQLANNSTESFSVETDRSGRFLIENVPQGIYTLTAAAEAYLYVPPNGNGIGSEMYTSQVSVTANQTVSEISIPMARGSTISGRILDASGRPASNVQVNALRTVYQQGRPTLQSSATKTTDDRGDFRLFYLAPGDYMLAAGLPGGARGVSAQRGGANPAAEVPVRTYYPGEVEPARASKIRVGSGSEISGVNMTLRTSRAYSVRGQISTTVPITPVIGPNGQARGGQVALSLSPRNGAIADQTGNTMGFALDGTGAASFQLDNVLAGEYYLVGRMNQPSPATGVVQAAANAAVFARMPIDVRDNVDGIRFVIPPPVDVKGSVISRTPSATRPPTMRLNLINQTTYVGFPAYGRGQATVEADGTFVIPAVPEGDYILDAVLPVGVRGGGGVFVSDVLFGGTSVIESGFHVDDKPPAPLQVVLNSGTGSIEGTLYNSAQKPVAGLTVVLVPLQHRRMPSRYQRTASADNGSFAFRAIPPGDYELYAWEEYLPTSEQDEAYLEKYKGKGQRVSVRAQSASMTELHVIPRESVSR